MPLSLGVRVDGLDALLARLPGRERTKQTLARRGTRELAARILAEAYKRCPVDTGELRRSGRVVRKAANSYEAKVEFTADHAEPVEYGHHTQSGSFVPAQPFLRPAVELYSGTRALNVVAREIRAGLRGMGLQTRG